MKFVYSNEDGSVSVVHAAPKYEIEKILGPLSDKEYENHVKSRSIPEQAKNVRSIEAKDIPEDREFRNAWVDKTESNNIDICCELALELKLAELREARKPKFEDLDREFMLNLEQGKDNSKVIKKKQILRDITNPLKQLKVKGKLNDSKLLEKIKKLSKIDE